MKGKTIIIGAGPAGLACGYRLAKAGEDVEVFESSQFVGGMSRSFDLWGQRVDLGPHRFFSKQEEINLFFNELIKSDFTLVNRQTRIYYNQRFFDYPLKLKNVLGNLSPGVIIQVLWFYMVQMVWPIKNPKNFEEWVTNRFGKKLFEIFFKHYTEKLWGIKCAEIDADWAAQRIKTLTLLGAVKSAVFGNKGNKHKTLVDQFAYPNNGTGELYERTARYISSNGGAVNLEEGIRRVLLDGTNKYVVGVELVSGEVKKAENIVSTMPLTNLLKGFENVPEPVKKAASELYFRNTILVYLEIDQQDLFSDNWLYIHSPEVKHGRITNFRNWSKELCGDKKTTILCLEYWCFDADEIWSQKEDFVISLAKEEVRKVDVIPKSANILSSKVVKIPKCYPVYETGYKKRLGVVTDYLRGIKGLYPIGRYGAFKYNNQDHSVLMGLYAADKILGVKDVDLWALNTDTEYQEEGSVKDILAQ